MKLFEEPQIEIATFAVEEIMTMSFGNGSDHDNTYTDWGDLAAWASRLMK